MRHGVVLTGIVSGLLLAGSGSTQSLGEVAAKEKAKQKAKRESLANCSKQQRAPRLNWAPGLHHPGARTSEHLSGVVELEVLVGKDGAVRVAKVKATAVDGRLIEEARQNALQRRYCPAYEDGTAVEAWVPLQIEFKPS